MPGHGRRTTTSQRAAYISVPPYIIGDLKPARVPFVLFSSSSFFAFAVSSSFSRADSSRVSFYRDCISINASTLPTYTSVRSLSISIPAGQNHGDSHLYSDVSGFASLTRTNVSSSSHFPLPEDVDFPLLYLFLVNALLDDGVRQ